MARVLFCLIAFCFKIPFILGNPNMSGHVFVVSEWLAKENHDEELWKRAKEIMECTLKNEQGCVRAHAWRQISHPGSPGQSKYKIVCHQEYDSIDAFDLHCQAPYIAHFFKTSVENPETAIVEDWTCRLFSEREN